MNLVENDLTSTVQLSYNPTEATIQTDDEDTQVTWTDTAEDIPQASSPLPERRSQRARRTSYASWYPCPAEKVGLKFLAI